MQEINLSLIFVSLQSDENVNLKLVGETISKTLKIYEKKDLCMASSSESRT
jgi:hypothetical protein